MLALSQTRDVNKIASFLKGEGVKRRCLGGFKHDYDLSQIVSDPKNTFLLAKDGDKEVGFVVLSRHTATSQVIHLCLRTIGEKTKKIVGMSFNYARHFLEATAIYAMYPQSARAVEKLCRHFNFRKDRTFEASIRLQYPEPYLFERLDLN
jgi:hypothetical protein